MSTLQTPKEIIDSLETLLDSALEHASHGWRALEKGFLYCPTCEWFDGIAQEGTQSEKWAVCPQCSSLVFRVRVGTLADPDQWPPTTEALVGTAPYHIAALIQKVHDAYQLVLGERMRHSGEPIQGLKPLPEPTFTTKYLQEQASQDNMHRAILNAIAAQSIFEYAILEAFVDRYKSYNLLVLAVEYCREMGFVSLGLPPVNNDLDPVE